MGITCKLLDIWVGNVDEGSPKAAYDTYTLREVDIDSNSNGKDAILNPRAVQVRHNENPYLHLNSG